MKELFTQHITWEKVGNHPQTAYQIEVEHASFSKESRTLTVDVVLNFVVPFLDSEKIRAILTSSVNGVAQVTIRYHYQDVILSEEEIISLFLPHMIAHINGKYTALTSCIQQDRLTLAEGKIVFSVLGEFVTDSLNRQVAPLFQDLLSSSFGIPRQVSFQVDQEEAARARLAMAQEEEKALRDLALAQEERMSAASPKGQTGQAAGSEKSRPAGGGGFGGGGKPWAGTPRRAKKDAPAEGSYLMGGKTVKGEPTPLGQVNEESGAVVVAGIVFAMDARTIKSGNKLMTVLITDKKTSLCLKAFVSAEKWTELEGLLKAGDYILAKGEAQFDTFDHEITVMVSAIEKSSFPQREDLWEGKRRVELHAHTKMSRMDGLNDVETLVETAARWGQPAVAITDHGVVQGFPDAAKKAAALGIKMIYGMEGYIFDDADCQAEDGTIDYKKTGTNHIILLAETQAGIQSLYKLVSLSHLDYFYKKPRIPWSVLEAHREGLIVGAACEAGEVFQAVLREAPEEELRRIALRYDYLEIQPVINNRFLVEQGTVADTEGLRELNRKIVALGEALDMPVAATTDAHYDEPESALFRNILMAGMGYKDAENGQGLYLRTTQEMMEEFSYLGEEKAREVVIDTPCAIAERVDGGILPVPKGNFPPKIQGAEETLRKTCMDRAHELYGDPIPNRIAERLEKELSSIISNGYAVMYVSAQMLVKKSMEDGYLVGSRGSVGSSLAATMAGITEVNPLEPHYICPQCKHLEWGDMNLYDCGVDMPEKDCPSCGAAMDREGFTIPFATFLGFDGDKEPDIDLNFAGEEQAVAHRYVGEIFGEKNVYKAGTISKVEKRTAYGYVKKFFEERNLSANKYEVDRLADNCTGVLRTTGQHPGGIIIVPDDHDITEFCPVQHPANDTKSDIITTHFDYHKIDKNLLKLDILGHKIPSMIRQLQDMTGVDPLQVDLTDRKVLSIFNGIEALEIQDPNYQYVHGTYAVPEFGTSFVRQMLDDIHPDKFADLVRISGFSHGTDVWLNNAQDYIRDGVATMREVISTRDDIMNYLILKGIENKTSFQIMEDVRKNRPLKEEQLAVMAEHGVPQWYIDSCIKIQYMFPRAHAVAYTMMSFRMAWYKVYYPLAFYATFFTSVASDFDTETILKGGQACLDRISEIAAMGKEAPPKTQGEVIVLEVAYEMYGRGYSFLPPALGRSHALRFWVEEDKVVLPFVAVDGMGETAANAFYQGYAEKPYGTIEEAVTRGGLNKTAVEGLRKMGVLDGMPETDQLTFF